MTTIVSRPSAAAARGQGPPTTGRRRASRRVRAAWWTFGAVGLVLVALAFAMSSRGIESGRLHNPDPKGTFLVDGYPRGQEPWGGVATAPLIVEGLVVVVAALFWGYYLRKSRRQGYVDPGIVLMAASTALLVWDPYANWVTYTVFNPRLLHLPASWPYASLAPNIEPLVNLFGYAFYFLIPAVIAVGIHRRWVAPRISPTSWWARHPLVVLFLVGLAVSIPFDMVAEMTMIRAELWIWVQAPGPVFHFGNHQWPILAEPLTFGPVLATTTVMLARDDTGRTVVQRVIERRRGPAGGQRVASQILVAFAVFSFAYVGVYCSIWAAFRVTGMSDSLDRPWTFEEMKVYDPQGRFEAAGEDGPFMEGVWSGPRIDAAGDEDGGEDEETAETVP